MSSEDHKIRREKDIEKIIKDSIEDSIGDSREEFIEECQNKTIVGDLKPALVDVQKRNKLKEFLLDPSTQTYSMSRLCMGIIVIVFMPVYFVFALYGVSVPSSIIVSSLASLASVYGLNSAMGAYGRYRGMIREAGSSMDKITVKRKTPEEMEEGG